MLEARRGSPEHAALHKQWLRLHEFVQERWAHPLAIAEAREANSMEAYTLMLYSNFTEIYQHAHAGFSKEAAPPDDLALAILVALYVAGSQTPQTSEARSSHEQPFVALHGRYSAPEPGIISEVTHLVMQHVTVPLDDLPSVLDVVVAYGNGWRREFVPTVRMWQSDWAKAFYILVHLIEGSTREGLKWVCYFLNEDQARPIHELSKDTDEVQWLAYGIHSRLTSPLSREASPHNRLASWKSGKGYMTDLRSFVAAAVRAPNNARGSRIDFLAGLFQRSLLYKELNERYGLTIEREILLNVCAYCGTAFEGKECPNVECAPPTNLDSLEPWYLVVDKRMSVKSAHAPYHDLYPRICHNKEGHERRVAYPADGDVLCPLCGCKNEPSSTAVWYYEPGSSTWPTVPSDNVPIEIATYTTWSAETHARDDGDEGRLVRELQDILSGKVTVTNWDRLRQRLNKKEHREVYSEEERDLIAILLAMDPPLDRGAQP